MATRCVTISYTNGVVAQTKDAGMRLRVERRLRQQFTRACRASGLPAAHVLRQFMRTYVEQRQSGQSELFTSPDTKRP